MVRGYALRLSYGVSGSEEDYRNERRADRRDTPLTVGDGLAPPPWAMVMLTTGWNSASAELPTRFGAYSQYGNYSANASTYDSFFESGSYGLYNFDGGIPRAYVDGHAHAGSDNLQPEMTSNPDPDALGWDLDSDWSIFADGPRQGAWVYPNWNRYGRLPPWFYTWQERWGMKWYAGGASNWPYYGRYTRF